MRTSWRHSLLVLGVALAGFVSVCTLSGCSFSAGDAEQITVAGSTTVLPIAEIAAEKFHDETGVDVLVSGLGSSAGIESVINKTAEIASSSRDLTQEEADHNLVKIPIAYDGIAVIVNEQNGVSELSLQQLRDIYSGAITNWSQLGGDDTDILVVNRDEASGTREAFRNIVMGTTSFDRRSAVLPGTGQVRDVVSRTKGAIGYISIGFVDTAFATTQVKALSIAGVEPCEKTVEDKTYPISRSLYFFCAKTPEGHVADYINFILSDEMGTTIREAGYIPMRSCDIGGALSE